MGTCQTIVLVRHFREQNLFINHGVDAELLLVRVGSCFVNIRKRGAYINRSSGVK